MSVSERGIPLSISDYSVKGTDGSEFDPNLSMDDIFGLSHSENFGSSGELDHASQLAPLPMSSSSLEVTELDQYLTMEHDKFPFHDELISSDVFDIFPFDDELINNYEMAGQLKKLSGQGNDISGPPSTDILSSEQNPITVCTTSNKEEVELVQLLLLSAEMIGDGKYDHASEVLSKCQKMSCQVGNATQRLGYYVSAALQEKIERQTGRMLNKAAKPVPDFAFNIDAEFDKLQEFFSLLAYYTIVVPFVKVFQFTSVQAIIDAVGNEQRIHVIYLGMRGGSHWTVLMEYLAHRAVSSSLPALELLKITAVGMDSEELWKAGKRLQELAKSLALPLSYKMVQIGGMEEIEGGLSSVKSGEVLAVNAPIVLRSLLYDPVLVENLIRVMKKMRPRILVNVEVEAPHNSPYFVTRFGKVLFYYMAYFDLLDATMTDRHDAMRGKHEVLFTGSEIRNMIVCEGKERFVRHVITHVWRCFFKQAGFRQRASALKLCTRLDCYYRNVPRENFILWRLMESVGSINFYQQSSLSAAHLDRPPSSPT